MVPETKCRFLEYSEHTFSSGPVFCALSLPVVSVSQAESKVSLLHLFLDTWDAHFGHLHHHSFLRSPGWRSGQYL